MDGSTSKEGRVEIAINGEFGAVCADEFTNTDATVVCKQLGYYEAVRYVSSQVKMQ